MSKHPISSVVGWHVGRKSSLGFACPLTLIRICLFGVIHFGPVIVIQVMVKHQNNDNGGDINDINDIINWGVIISGSPNTPRLFLIHRGKDLSCPVPNSFVLHLRFAGSENRSNTVVYVQLLHWESEVQSPRSACHESNRRCVPQPPAYVSVSHQLLHHWLVPGERSC